jgi:hypothetical protein
MIIYILSNKKKRTVKVVHILRKRSNPISKVSVVQNLHKMLGFIGFSNVNYCKNDRLRSSFGYFTATLL